MQYENERIEFKSQMIDDIYKEVIAFANTDGGVIYLGINDNGNLIGIDNVDETYLAEYDEMTDEELMELLNIKKTRAYLLSRQMHENGLIDILGRGAGKKYRRK